MNDAERKLSHIKVEIPRNDTAIRQASRELRNEVKDVKYFKEHTKELRF